MSFAMTGCNVIAFPGRGTDPALGGINRITKLAQDADEILSRHGHHLDLSGMLDLLEQASQTLAELGAILLTGEDRQQMEILLVSLDTLIARTRDRLRRLNHVGALEE